MNLSMKKVKQRWQSNVLLPLFLFVFIAPLWAAENQPERVYFQYCAACHADDGSGEMPGVPDLRENKSWLNQSPAKLFNKLALGFQTPGSVMRMPARGGAVDLSDKELLEALTFLQQKVSN